MRNHALKINFITAITITITKAETSYLHDSKNRDFNSILIITLKKEL